VRVMEDLPTARLPEDGFSFDVPILCRRSISETIAWLAKRQWLRWFLWSESALPRRKLLVALAGLVVVVAAGMCVR